MTSLRRQDDEKWGHDLFNEYESNRRIGTKDLRLKLLKKGAQQATQSGNGSASGVRDLREKLSGSMYADIVDAELPKAKPVREIIKPVRKNVMVEVPEPETKKVASLVTRKKTQQKADSLDGFLQSLGLEKYSITFQAEEVDMSTLVHMTEDDLKALGIPMGPRKKIILGLESRT